MQKKFAFLSLGHAVLVFIYTAVVAEIMQNGQNFFGPMNGFLGPVAILMLFVLSAAIVGALVLGRPALMYFNGEKKEAVKFFSYTVGWLLALTVMVFVVLVVRK